WLLGPVKHHLNNTGISINEFELSPSTLVALIQLVEDGKVNFSAASGKIFHELLLHPGKTPLAVAQELNLVQEKDSGAVLSWVDEVIANMPDKVSEYKKGKKGLLGLFAGEVKKLSKGKADMQLVKQLLNEKLSQ
ncbi:MAG: Asp-tRNA(Asn)/Glu-tRNA(Gln) amidotransferase GatCAB subunit B, partial [Ginsengibacter sp.]